MGCRPYPRKGSAFTIRKELRPLTPVMMQRNVALDPYLLFVFLGLFYASRIERLSALWRKQSLLYLGPLLRGVAPAPHEKLSFSTSSVYFLYSSASFLKSGNAFSMRSVWTQYATRTQPE